MTATVAAAPHSSDVGVEFITDNNIIHLNTNLGKRILSTCVDICQEPNYVNCYTVYTASDACTNLAGPFLQNGVSSINFHGSTRCRVFKQAKLGGRQPVSTSQSIKDGWFSVR
jgi:hypothetical protein